MSESLMKHSVNDIERIASAIAKSNLFGVKTTEQAMVLCLIAQAENRHPALAALDYSIIQNKPSKNAAAIQRDFLAAGGSIEWHRSDDEVCDATFSHPKGGTLRIKWDLERAKQAQLDKKDNWIKYTAAMLRARTVSEGCDAIFPSPAKLYPPEIIQDFSEPKLVNPKVEFIHTELYPQAEPNNRGILAPKGTNLKNIEYEPEYKREYKDAIVTDGPEDDRGWAGIKGAPKEAPDFILTRSDADDSIADELFSELASQKSIAKQLIERIQKLEPSRNLDETVAFLTGNEKATFAGIDLIKSKEKQAKLETLINTAQLWIKSYDIKHTGTIPK